MKTLNQDTNYQFTWPKLSFTDRMALLGYAKYMGYEFDYNFIKRRAMLIQTTEEGRSILYIQKINGKIIGIDKAGNKHILDKEMHLTKLLFNAGVFKIPNPDIGINSFIKNNLSILVYDTP